MHEGLVFSQATVWVTIWEASEHGVDSQRHYWRDARRVRTVKGENLGRLLSGACKEHIREKL